MMGATSGEACLYPGVTTFPVKFLGCKVSQADAMLARSRLLEAGHEEAPEAEADLHVVNTCCITREAEAKSRQSVRRSARDGRAGRVIVTGCAANLNAAPVRRDRARGDGARRHGGRRGRRGRRRRRARAASTWSPTRCRMTGIAAGRTRGFVKVQDGCDCHCSYCIIPKVRGGARSRPASAVLREARRRVEQGQPEMVMTGHLGRRLSRSRDAASTSAG